jgi:hypothetical protein
MKHHNILPILFATTLIFLAAFNSKPAVVTSRKSDLA